jgi:hypothetical protein
MAISIIDTLWVMLAALLVFFMNLGFAAVESGFARAKNTVKILSKNFIVFAVSSLDGGQRERKRGNLPLWGRLQSYYLKK